MQFANRMKSCLRKFFPEWQVVKNLWARRAWQNTVKHQILQRRIARVFDFNNVNHRHKGGKDERFNLGTTEKLHSNAAEMLGLVVHNKKEEEEKKREEQDSKKGFFGRLGSKRVSKTKTMKADKNDLDHHEDELKIHLEKVSKENKTKHNAVWRGSIGAGQLKLQTKLSLRKKREKKVGSISHGQILPAAGTYTGSPESYTELLDILLLSFQSKIKSEYMLKQLFQKLSTDQEMSKEQLLILIKNLANNKSLNVESYELVSIWKHLTTECGSTTKAVTVVQLLEWHGTFQKTEQAEKNIPFKRRKSILAKKLKPQEMIAVLKTSFRGKIKNEFMLQQLFMKLDVRNDGILDQKEVLLLAKNLANDTTLVESSPEFEILWNHLTTECGKGVLPHSNQKTELITIEQLIFFHGPFQ